MVHPEAREGLTKEELWRRSKKKDSESGPIWDETLEVTEGSRIQVPNLSPWVSLVRPLN